MNTDPNYRLPDEILEHLEYSEIPDTLRIWELAGSYYGDEPSSFDFEHGSEQMWSHIHQSSKPAILRLVTWRTSLPIAACIAVILCIGVLFTQQPTSIVAPLGEQLTHQLPDGSEIILNSGSHIEYRKNFGDSSRELTLHEGEIFLNVEHQSIPFIVQSFDATTEVLGTSFNVRSWPDELQPSTGVIVKTGQVRVTPRSDSNLSVTIGAGESAHIRSRGLTPLIKSVSNDESTPYLWIDGGFKFSGQPLGNVAKEIERRYNINIHIESPTLRSLSIGILKQSPENAEDIIQDICGLHCKYVTVPDGFLLSPR